MNFVYQLFGQGKDLTALQMSMRGVTVFILALVLIRISGRRSFGLHTPLDNIISIMLGAVLSRAVVGASPFVPTIVCCLIIVLVHRLLGTLVARNEKLGNIIEGKKMLLFKDGRFIDYNMKRAQLCKENIMQGIRESALTDDLDKIDRVYIERNGVISVVKK